MTRNVVLSFIQNLTTSKKSNQLQASSSKKIPDATHIDVANGKKLPKSNDYDTNIDFKLTAVNGKLKNKKKISTAKRKFFLRKSR